MNVVGPTVKEIKCGNQKKQNYKVHLKKPETL